MLARNFWLLSARHVLLPGCTVTSVVKAGVHLEHSDLRQSTPLAVLIAKIREQSCSSLHVPLAA